MAETRSLIISCVFVCLLFASSTVMCTVEGEECHLVLADAALAAVVRTVKGTLVKLDTKGVCSGTEKICDAWCPVQAQLLGKVINGGNIGKCIYPEDDALNGGYCACCQLN
ncbi:hypothetical protein C5167_041464 [Papaver somniferum]|uniref:uncharacterized protein LOC113327679 n=1 Tax=Papaver somniferum TaxID=3469 RepID=UPI000E7058FC|nr:uncharacterized protein LOC113327679 [Papaver somniferum]RZC85281.1 hypothetical protein C5167_041464 [Papaver somniferum]